jgi:glycosyl transferase, family 25
MLIPVIAISLKESADRRAMISRRLAQLGVPFTFLDAVDGRVMSDAEADRLCPGRKRLSRRWPMSNREVACSASHLAALRVIAEGASQFGCILEDDAVPEDDFPAVLDADWLAQLPRFDLFKLGGDVNMKGDQLAAPIGVRGDRQICTPLHPSYGARGYIASRAGARRVLARSQSIVDTADVFLFRAPFVPMSFLETRPFVVGNAGLPSTLNGDNYENSPMPWWRPPLAWLPYTLATLGRKARRYLAFVSSRGVAGLFQIKRIAV